MAFAGAATLPVRGAVLALAAVPRLRRPSAVRPVLILQAVPNEISQKPGPLTDEELDEIKRHPEIGSGPTRASTPP